ncbi:hypothetical protein [Subtercola lobariae]|uniref:Uncharacterized protein n=1 Tax=Subtercola lobariae TaxID=1588641 RepID=A0A917F0G3_9MICO|nr:hypothetical protein [Subtercola lobariae]GGF39911.1 hypothetical protein GCM10011399_36010 [Subtercola lobariae]
MAANEDLSSRHGAALARLVGEFDHLGVLTRDGLVLEFGAPDDERLFWDSRLLSWGDFSAVTVDGSIRSMTLGWTEHPVDPRLVAPIPLCVVEELETWNQLVKAAVDSGLPFEVVGWPEKNASDDADARTENSRRIRFATRLSLVLTDGTVDHYWRRVS